MKRKTFIKKIMGMGISRNTATAAADAASRAEIPLLIVAARIRTMQRVFAGETWSKPWLRAFDWALLDQAKRIQRRIRPLADKRRNLDGLRVKFAMVDELSAYGGGGHD